MLISCRATEGKGSNRHWTMKEVGRPEESTDRRKGGGADGLGGRHVGIGGKEAIGKERAECQIYEGSGGPWGSGWDVSQLLFAKYHTNKGNQRK